MHREGNTEDEILACALAERGMALRQFESYGSFSVKAAQAHFKKVHEEDLSEYVLPTMYRFETLAGRFFNHPRFASILKRLLPKEFLNNAIAGYLMPTIIKLGLACYMGTVFQKP